MYIIVKYEYTYRDSVLVKTDTIMVSSYHNNIYNAK